MSETSTGITSITHLGPTPPPLYANDVTDGASFRVRLLEVNLYVMCVSHESTNGLLLY